MKKEIWVICSVAILLGVAFAGMGYGSNNENNENSPKKN